MQFFKENHTEGMMRYNSLYDLMIYTLKRGDIPSLSAWIKKSRSEERDFLSLSIVTAQ